MENTVLKFNPESYTLSGTRNSSQTGKVSLTNIGEVDFICRSVTSSCGCTTTNDVKPGTTLKPGESVEISFTRQLNSPGTKYIYVSGNCVTVSLPIAAQIL
jgi:hypothetical protein